MTITPPHRTEALNLDTAAADIAGLFREYGYQVAPEQACDALVNFATNVGLGPDAIRTPDPDRLVPPPTADRVRVRVNYGFSIETRTGFRWTTVRTGVTPSAWKPTQTALDSIARTILSNAGPMLGLDAKDPMPTVRVRTWHRGSGPTGSAIRVGTRRQTSLLTGWTARIRSARFWLAALVAPPGADVHDPDETACPGHLGLLEAVFWGQTGQTASGGVWADSTASLGDAEDAGWIKKTDSDDGPPYRLTKAGERELARLWGPDRVPPWLGGYFFCDDHPMYDAAPGAPLGCPKC